MKTEIIEILKGVVDSFAGQKLSDRQADAINDCKEFLATQSTQPTEQSEAVEFAEWINDSLYRYEGDNIWSKQGVVLEDLKLKYTTADLYQLFKSSKSNP